MSRLIYLWPLLLISCAPRHIYKTQLLSEATQTKLCFVGDVGTGKKAQARVALALAKENCHQIYMLGDLIYPSGISGVDDPELEDKFLKYYRPIMQQENGPHLQLILGNHDYRGSASAWKKVAQLHPKLVFPHYYYLQQDSGLCVVNLDSNAFKVLLYYPRALGQHNWLQQLQKHLQDHCKLRIALTHHPYAIQGGQHAPASGLLKFFFERAVIGKFDLLISGHEHIQIDAGSFQGTRQLITGVGGDPRPGHAAGYIVLMIRHGQQQMTYSHELKEISSSD
jgi:predicted phosphodiesterase